MYHFDKQTFKAQTNWGYLGNQPLSVVLPAALESMQPLTQATPTIITPQKYQPSPIFGPISTMLNAPYQSPTQAHLRAAFCST